MSGQPRVGEVQAIAIRHPQDESAWRGVVDQRTSSLGWTRVWRCPHKHPSIDEASACATASECVDSECPNPVAHSPHLIR